MNMPPPLPPTQLGLPDQVVGQLLAAAGDTFVDPPELWSALYPELLASRSALDGAASGRFAPQLMEACIVVEPSVTRLAAQRRTDADVERMLEKAIAARTPILEAVAAGNERAATRAMWAHLEEAHLAAAEGHLGGAESEPQRPPAPSNEEPQ